MPKTRMDITIVHLKLRDAGLSSGSFCTISGIFPSLASSCHAGSLCSLSLRFSIRLLPFLYMLNNNGADGFVYTVSRFLFFEVGYYWAFCL